jgi:hypothetical protein
MRLLHSINAKESYLEARPNLFEYLLLGNLLQDIFGNSCEEACTRQLVLLDVHDLLVRGLDGISDALCIHVCLHLDRPGGVVRRRQHGVA